MNIEELEKTIKTEIAQRIQVHVLEGLTTDGAHHKQYALEEVLRELFPIEYESIKKAIGWEDGIPS